MLATCFRNLRCIGALAVSLVVATLMCTAADVRAQAPDARRWMPADLLTELGADAPQALADYLGEIAHQRQPVSRAECAAALLAVAELRPSLTDLTCATAEWLFAPVQDGVRQAPEAYRQATLELLQASPGRALNWRDTVAMRAGAVLRLDERAMGSKSLQAHAAFRYFKALSLLDAGQTDAARAQLAAALPVACRRACALRALELVVRGRAALASDRPAVAHRFAQQAQDQLKNALRREPHAAIAAAAPLAALLGQIDRAHEGLLVLDAADKAAARSLPARDALVRHAGAVRYGLLLSRGDVAAAAAQRETLVTAHGRRLNAYALTRALLAEATALADQGPATTAPQPPGRPP